jgi:hypothetical protein
VSVLTEEQQDKRQRGSGQCEFSWRAGGLSAKLDKRVKHLVQDETEVYHVQLSGRFELRVDGRVEFYKRMLVIFLGLLEVPGDQSLLRLLAETGLAADAEPAVRRSADFGGAATSHRQLGQVLLVVDEKYVLVLKNDKPDAEMKRWMYIYFSRSPLPSWNAIGPGWSMGSRAAHLQNQQRHQRGDSHLHPALQNLLRLRVH